MTEIFTFAAIFVGTYSGVELFRRWSLRQKILDIPNARSSHKNPTPRGGGLVIVAVSLIFYVLCSIILPVELHWSFIFGALGVATISWLDDLFSISSGWRFLVHFLAAITVIFYIGFFQNIYVPLLGDVKLGFWGAILTLLWIIWLTNAFNFMDGIDGIAGLEAGIAGIGWLIVGKILGLEETGLVGGIVGFSSLGFLVHNWQPAKIFMGDVGSAFLGFTFAVIPLFALNSSRADVLSKYLIGMAFILVFCFVFDSVFTFIRRSLKREKVWEAHREHLYQRLIIKGYSHQSVATIYGVISIILITFLIFSIKYGL